MEEMMAVIRQNSEKEYKTCITIDGFDASGKTHFAQKIQTALERQNIRSCVVAIDDFISQKRCGIAKENSLRRAFLRIPMRTIVS